MFSWSEIAFVAIFGLLAAGAIHLVFLWLMKRARDTMGIAAGPKLASLSKQRGPAIAVVFVVAAIVPSIGRFSHPVDKIQWRSYQSPQGAYSAEFPGEPKPQIIPVDVGNGKTLSLNYVGTELKGNGSYGILEMPLSGSISDEKNRGELMNINNGMMAQAKAVPENTDFPFPAAWGMVECAETAGHVGSDQEQRIIVRSWTTRHHQYAAAVTYKVDSPSEKAAKRFLDSIKPPADFVPPTERYVE